MSRYFINFSEDGPVKTIWYALRDNFNIHSFLYVNTYKEIVFVNRYGNDINIERVPIYESNVEDYRETISQSIFCDLINESLLYDYRYYHNMLGKVHTDLISPTPSEEIFEYSEDCEESMRDEASTITDLYRSCPELSDADPSEFDTSIFELLEFEF